MPTLFEKACKENNALDVHKMLNLFWPVPVEIRTKKSESALMLASANGAEEVCRVLIENNCYLEAKDLQEKTALFYAVENNHERVVKLLIEKGADVNKRDADRNTVLHIAAKANNFEIITFLMQSMKFKYF
jgi:ankyrin repeat protein